jgi:hypothetical protein
VGQTVLYPDRDPVVPIPAELVEGERVRCGGQDVRRHRHHRQQYPAHELRNTVDALDQ